MPPFETPESMSAAVDSVGDALAASMGFNADTNTDIPADNSATESQGADEGNTPSGDREPSEASSAPAPAPAAEGTEPKDGPTPAPKPLTADDVPKSWKPEFRDKWTSVDPSVRAYIHTREAEMAAGVEQLKPAAQFGASMHEAISPFLGVMQQFGIDPHVHVRTLMNAHHTLALGTQAQKVDMLQRLAKDYGINLATAAPAADGTPPQGPAPEVLDLQSRQQQLESRLAQQDARRAAEIRAEIDSRVEAFRTGGKAPLYDQVESDMVPFIRSGLSLEQAYERAVWANPVTRAQELSRQQAEADAKRATDKAAHAAKARNATAANVKTSAKVGTNNEPLGSMDDTLRETFRAIQARG